MKRIPVFRFVVALCVAIGAVIKATMFDLFSPFTPRTALAGGPQIGGRDQTLYQIGRDSFERALFLNALATRPKRPIDTVVLSRHGVEDGLFPAITGDVFGKRGIEGVVLRADSGTLFGSGGMPRSHNDGHSGAPVAGYPDGDG